jgi:anthranilate synthase component I
MEKSLMSKPFYIKTESREILSDLTTPVAVYLRFRDIFPRTLLLESADYRGSENSISFVCGRELASFTAEKAEVRESLPDGSVERLRLQNPQEVLTQFKEFQNKFTFVSPEAPFAKAGFFGFCSYQSVQYFEDIKLNQNEGRIPDMLYSLFSYVVVIDHFHNRMTVLRNSLQEAGSADENEGIGPSTLDSIVHTLQERPVTSYHFRLKGDESSNFSDGEYHSTIEKCKEHIQRGDIFQIVPSRRFEQSFEGDEFCVYRVLRSINPSPYLFFFDYGSFKIFGSSPEAQLIVDEGKASIFPIAGTFRREGDEESDRMLGQRLLNDPKESAEHVMLVDLARNDLSKHCDKVVVDTFKEVQFYSHVIHLVSKVSGYLRDPQAMLDVFADTFPAGTLSGAPKYRAMELIDTYENGPRDFYGGCIGLFGRDGSCNHAIIIRSFLSLGKVLYYQAGGGVVGDSLCQNEVDEAKNKLLALKHALEKAEEMFT